MKKAQGLSMNVIIIAALAILVLVILSVLFINGTLNFGTNTQSCESNGGTCERACTAPSFPNPTIDCGERRVCCIGITGEE